MKILHVNINNYGGGVEQYLHQLFIELNAKGHKNIFLYGEKHNEIINLPNVEYFNIENITHFHCNKLNSKLECVQEIINSLKPNVVYIHQVLNSALINFLTQKLPSIRFMHGFKMVCPEGLKTLKSVNNFCDYPLDYGCQRRAYFYRCMPRNPFTGLALISNSKKICQIHKKHSFIIVASHFMKSVLIKNGFDKKRIKVIPYFTYLPKLNNNLSLNNPKKILTLGRIVQAKGFYQLIDAFSFLDGNIQLDIVGDGPETLEIKKVVRQRGLTSKVNFYGWLNHKKLSDLYVESSVVVVPSIWPEPFGIVGIEAMAYGRPVVAFDSGGISEWLIDGHTGFLIRAGDNQELAAKIKVLLNNPELSKFMGENGREIVKKHFIPEAHLKSLLPLFEKTIQEFNNLNSYR
jgi:glycosyltransferase involved in cell wall biosynthesis